METEKRNDTQVHLNHCYQGEYKTNCKYGEDDSCPAKPKKEVEELKPMVDFILEIDWMTTTEFCNKQGIPLPTMVRGSDGEVDIKKSADLFLQIDAVKHRLFVEHAKKLARRPKTIKGKKYTEEQIEVMADNATGDEGYGEDDGGEFKEGWEKGFAQCQKMGLDYTEEDLIKAKISVYERYTDWGEEVAHDASECIERLSKSLNKQGE